MYLVLMKHLINTLIAFLLFSTTAFADTNITDQEVLDFIQQIEQAVVDDNADLLNDFFAKDALSDKVASMMGTNTKYAKIGTLTAIKSLKIGDRVIQYKKKGGSYKHIKTYEKTGVKHVLFRLYTGTGINYHDMELIKVKNEIKVSDIYVYLSGQNISTSLADLMNTTLESKKSSAYRLGMIAAYVKKGNYSDAMAMFKKLDKKLKNTKTAQIIYLQILSSTNENKKYLKAMEEYKKNYPNDPSLPLMLVDYHILRNEYDKALDNLNKLDATIDKDPFLDYIRGNIYSAMNDNTSAMVCFERLYNYMPDLKEGHLGLILLYLQKEMYDNAKPLIADYSKLYGEGDFKTLAISYPEFEEYLLFNN